jgi:endonuclease YncB( thermonuclease family)
MRDALVIALVLVAAVPTFASADAALTREATVVHVDDGDTIEVWIDGSIERVRYIGIDAPELAHHGLDGARGGEAAKRLNQALLRSRRVRLEFDQERRDRYGRLLAYVWVGGTMINAEMARHGYARTLTIPPNIRYERWFLNAEAEAQAAHLGLWGEGDLDDPPMTPSRHTQPRSGDPRGPRPSFARRAAITITRPLSAPCPTTVFSRRGRWHAGRTTLPPRAPTSALHRGQRPRASAVRPGHDGRHLNDAGTWDRHTS